MFALGIAIATVVSFVASAVLYSIPSVAALVTRTSTPRPGIPMPVQMASVLLRSLLASGLVGGLMLAAEWHGPLAGGLLGLSLVVMPLILLMGGVVHENTSPSAAGIHLIDWILKLGIIGIIVGLFT